MQSLTRLGKPIAKASKLVTCFGGLKGAGIYYIRKDLI